MTQQITVGACLPAPDAACAAPTLLHVVRRTLRGRVVEGD